MATTRFLLGIICLIVSGSSGLPDRGNLSQKSAEARVLEIAKAQVGTRERSGQNDGDRVEAYLNYAGAKKGDSWCAAFVSWVFGQAGYTMPRTAWSPALFPVGKLRHKPASALVFGIYFPAIKRIAHCGFIEKRYGDWLLTIEGNTNVVGSREGDGVYCKWRPARTIRYYADWLHRKEHVQ